MATNNIPNEAQTAAANPYGEFETSVLSAAERKAQKIDAETQRLCRAAHDEILAGVASDGVAEHRSRVRVETRRAAAAARQENRRRLLKYREELVNGLFAEAAENLTAFADSSDYQAYLKRTLLPLAEKAAEGCTVLVREKDLALAPFVQTILPKAQLRADAAIRIGGAKVVIGHILYDETLDDALRSGRSAFLAECGLHVDEKGGEAK